MPQLAVETFPSQIFWILLGFCLVYFFISKIVTPNIEETLQNRATHVGDLLNAAKQLRTEAEKLETDAVSALESTKLEAMVAESELLTEYRERSLKEKEELYNLFSKRSKIELEAISKSADETFEKISNDMDKILDTAIKTISRSVSKK